MGIACSSTSIRRRLEDRLSEIDVDFTIRLVKNIAKLALLDDSYLRPSRYPGSLSLTETMKVIEEIASSMGVEIKREDYSALCSKVHSVDLQVDGKELEAVPMLHVMKCEKELEDRAKVGMCFVRTLEEAYAEAFRAYEEGKELVLLVGPRILPLPLPTSKGPFPLPIVGLRKGIGAFDKLKVEVNEDNYMTSLSNLSCSAVGPEGAEYLEIVVHCDSLFYGVFESLIPTILAIEMLSRIEDYLVNKRARLIIVGAHVYGGSHIMPYGHGLRQHLGLAKGEDPSIAIVLEGLGYGVVKLWHTPELKPILIALSRVSGYSAFDRASSELSTASLVMKGIPSITIDCERPGHVLRSPEKEIELINRTYLRNHIKILAKVMAYLLTGQINALIRPEYLLHRLLRGYEGDSGLLELKAYSKHIGVLIDGVSKAREELAKGSINPLVMAKVLNPLVWGLGGSTFCKVVFLPVLRKLRDLRVLRKIANKLSSLKVKPHPGLFKELEGGEYALRSSKYVDEVMKHPLRPSVMRLMRLLKELIKMDDRAELLSAIREELVLWRARIEVEIEAMKRGLMGMPHDKYLS